jgi:hypothetical protein
MTKYLVKWQQNESLMPSDPTMMAQLLLSLLDGAREDLKSGKVIDWGSYCDASGGYCIVEGNESELFDQLLKWYPYITFDAKPVLNVEQVIGVINKVMIESRIK